MNCLMTWNNNVKYNDWNTNTRGGRQIRKISACLVCTHYTLGRLLCILSAAASAAAVAAVLLLFAAAAAAAARNVCILYRLTSSMYVEICTNTCIRNNIIAACRPYKSRADLFADYANCLMFLFCQLPPKMYGKILLQFCSIMLFCSCLTGVFYAKKCACFMLSCCLRGVLRFCACFRSFCAHHNVGGALQYSRTKKTKHSRPKIEAYICRHHFCLHIFVDICEPSRTQGSPGGANGSSFAIGLCSARRRILAHNY